MDAIVRKTLFTAQAYVARKYTGDVLAVHSEIPRVTADARRCAVVAASSSATVLLEVSRGMMDVGWAERVARELAGVARAFVDGGIHGTLVRVF